MLVAATTTHGALAISASSGQIVTDLPSLTAGAATPTGGIVVGTASGRITSLNSEGRVVWTRSLHARARLMGADRDHIALATGDQVAVLSADSGHVLWSRHSKSADLRIALDGQQVIVESGNMHLSALSLDSGKVNWSIISPHKFASAPVASGGVTYVGTATGLLGFSDFTGLEIWDEPLGAPVLSPPAVVEGMLAVSTDGSAGTTSLFIPST
jgi:outer membrane protein assembly factor BamB